MTRFPPRPALLLASILWAAAAAEAATLTVTTLADAGPGSLREAIALAGPLDTIDFAVTGTIFLTSGSLSIAQNLVIDGPGAELGINSGSNFPTSRAFVVSSAADVTIRDLSIGGGFGPNGTVILNEGTLLLERVTVAGNSATNGISAIKSTGSLTLRSCLVYANQVESGGTVSSSGPTIVVESTVFRDNFAYHGTAGLGVSAGSLVMRDSSFERNQADGFAALTIGASATADIERSLFFGNDGHVSGGAIYNGGSLTLTNVTVSGNRTSDKGAGIWNAGTVTANHCTVVFNDASAGAAGGGVLNQGTFTARNTIFAGNLSFFTAPDFAGTLTSAGHNLIQDPTGTVIVGDTTGNLLGIDPELGPLADNGGPTLTHAVGAPVIDAGNNAGAPATDQRGLPRIADGDEDGTATADIGAFELESECLDGDGDGFGTPGDEGCPGGAATDCDDADVDVFPGATETCDGLDNDCDGIDDEGNPGGGVACGTSTVGACELGVTTCTGGSLPCVGNVEPVPEACGDGIDNDCDGSTDEGQLVAVCTISPTNLNVHATSSGFQIGVSSLSNVCDPSAPVVLDAGRMTAAYISRAGGQVLPDPASLACSDPHLGELGIVENLSDRQLTGNDLKLKFNRASDGDCRTADGDRQDLFALLSDARNGETVPICIGGTIDGVAFECCTPAKVTKAGNR